jgi:hypothetical protein
MKWKGVLTVNRIPNSVAKYPTLIALLDTRRRLAVNCKYCGLVNAAWGTPNWTRDHPTCKRGYEKKVAALKRLRHGG